MVNLLYAEQSKSIAWGRDADGARLLFITNKTDVLLVSHNIYILNARVNDDTLIIVYLPRSNEEFC
jgi:hypothetical protein